MPKLQKTIILIGDIVIFYLSLILTLIIRYGAYNYYDKINAHLAPFSILLPLWLLVFYLADLYHHRTGGGLALIRRTLNAVIISLVVSAAAFYLFTQVFQLTPKTNLVIFGVLMAGLIYAWRFFIFRFFAVGAEKVIVLGNSPAVEGLINYLHNNPQIGYKTVSWFKDLKDEKKLKELIRKEGVAQIIIHPEIAGKHKIKLANWILSYEVNLTNFFDFYELIFGKLPLDELGESWIIENINRRKAFYDPLRNIIDFILAAALLVLLSPLIALIGLLAAATTGLNPIFKQKRIGKDGQAFILYKFRTMKNSAGPLWTTKNDPRLTNFGKIIRFAHLDELPQLVNIIKGDISFVGPRPERVELAKEYQKFKYYNLRHLIKPGLTGWAQINYKPSSSLEEAKEKLCYDIYYVKNRSLALDILIILKTIRYLFVNNS